MGLIHASQKWNDTGFDLIQGRSYQYEAVGHWKDWYIDCDADGYSRWFTGPLGWAKRVFGARWFQLIGAVEQDPSRVIILGTRGKFIAPHSGRLWAFANDAWVAYGNNSGSLELTIVERP